MVGSLQSVFSSTLFFFLFIFVSFSSEAYSQRKIYISLFAETQSDADMFYPGESIPLPGISAGYNINQHLDVHAAFSYTSDPLLSGLSEIFSEKLSRDAFSVLLGFNIKPWGTFENGQKDLGRFTPYIGIEFKQRIITEEYCDGSLKQYERILICNLGAELSVSKLFSLLANVGYKYPASYSYSVPSEYIDTFLAVPDVNVGFGVKFNLL